MRYKVTLFLVAMLTVIAGRSAFNPVRDGFGGGWIAASYCSILQRLAPTQEWKCVAKGSSLKVQHPSTQTCVSFASITFTDIFLMLFLGALLPLFKPGSGWRGAFGAWSVVAVLWIARTTLVLPTSVLASNLPPWVGKRGNDAMIPFVTWGLYFAGILAFYFYSYKHRRTACPT